MAGSAASGGYEVRISTNVMVSPSVASLASSDSSALFSWAKPQRVIDPVGRSKAGFEWPHR